LTARLSNCRDHIQTDNVVNSLGRQCIMQRAGAKVNTSSSHSLEEVLYANWRCIRSATHCQASQERCK
jgi:hypothetical protein